MDKSNSELLRQIALGEDSVLEFKQLVFSAERKLPDSKPIGHGR